MNNLSCNSVGVELLTKIIPKYMRNYIWNFLKSFHLKSVSHLTIWRWMKYSRFNYCEQKKIYFIDKHEDECTGTVTYRKSLENNIFPTKYDLPMDPSHSSSSVDGTNKADT